MRLRSTAMCGGPIEQARAVLCTLGWPRRPGGKESIVGNNTVIRCPSRKSTSRLGEHGRSTSTNIHTCDFCASTDILERTASSTPSYIKLWDRGTTVLAGNISRGREQQSIRGIRVQGIKPTPSSLRVARPPRCSEFCASKTGGRLSIFP